MYNKAYYERHRDEINAAQRERYRAHRDELNAVRRARYRLNRECILERQKNDRERCPLCKLSFRRQYIKKHVDRRHSKSRMASAA